jgi:riboflavin synthase
MFTGIIEGLGTIRSTASAGKGMRLAIQADFVLEDARIGDSLAVNGACLTAVSIAGARFEVDVSPETVARTTFQTIAPGSRVNIERALKLSDRLDGHMVSGHVDGTGRIAAKEHLDNALLLKISAAPELCRYMIAKGSVAVEGISLTINRMTADGFEAAVIPHTAAVTTIGWKRTGDVVNIETDMIGKYVEKFVRQTNAQAGPDKPGSQLSMGLLEKTGFI